MASLAAIETPPLLGVRDRAVSARFLRAFMHENMVGEQEPEWTTAGLVDALVKPGTADLGLDFVNYSKISFGAGGAAAGAAVDFGTTTHFVSHAWRGSFASLVRAVLDFDAQHHYDRQAAPHFYWLDVFAVSQHKNEHQRQDLKELGHVVETAKATLLFLQPWSSPVLLTRIWCLYEIHLTLISTANPSEGLIMLTAPATRELADSFDDDEESINSTSASSRGGASLLRTASGRVIEKDLLERLGDYNDLYLIMASIDCRHAEATIESDRVRIMHDIESSIGFSRMNKAVKAALFSWLGSTAHTAALHKVAQWKAQGDGLIGGTPREAEQVMNVARLLRDLGQLEEAQSIIVDIIAVLEKGTRSAAEKETSEDPERALFLAKDCLSGVWRRLGKNLEASVRLQRQVFDHFWPFQSISSWISAGNLARNMLALGSVKSYCATPEPGDSSFNISFAEDREGWFVKAEAILRNAIVAAAAKDQSPSQCLHTTHVQDGLAICLFRQNRIDEALAEAEAAVASARTLLGAGLNTLTLALKLNSLGCILLSLSHSSSGAGGAGTSSRENARLCFVECIAIARESGFRSGYCGINFPLMVFLWNCSSSMSDTKQAEALWDEAVRIFMSMDDADISHVVFQEPDFIIAQRSLEKLHVLTTTTL